jgi:hypothetical protein
MVLVGDVHPTQVVENAFSSTAELIGQSQSTSFLMMRTFTSALCLYPFTFCYIPLSVIARCVSVVTFRSPERSLRPQPSSLWLEFPVQSSCITMETLAYIYAAIAYEDPSPDPELRLLHHLNGKLPQSILAGTLAVGVAASSITPAQALMRYGDVGPGVEQLQQQLNVDPDQVYGSQTQRAVSEFQWDNNLYTDGIAGSQTLSALGLPPGLSADGGGSVPISGTVVVTAQALNVRTYASLYAPVRNVLYNGDSVALTGASRFADGYNWVQLTQGGWVAEYYLSYGGGGERPVSGTAYVNAYYGLNVRDYPAGYVIDTLPDREEVELTGDRQYAAGSYWVKLSGRGWVAEDYLAYY